MTLVSLIAAVARNGVIGNSRGKFGLPWHLPQDLKRFKDLTMGKPLIIGRISWQMIAHPLPGRRVIVLSRKGFAAEGVEVAPDLTTALAMCKDAPEVMIGGGAQIYAQALPLAGRLYLTEVDLDAPGDTSFPLFDRREWRQQDRHHVAGDPPFNWVIYDKAG